MATKEFFQKLAQTAKLWENAKRYRFYFLYHHLGKFQLIISEFPKEKPTIKNGETTRKLFGNVQFQGNVGEIDETYNQFILDRFFNRNIRIGYEQINDVIVPENPKEKSYVKYLLVPKKNYNPLLSTVKTYQPPTPKRRDDRKTVDSYLDTVKFWDVLSANCKLLSGTTYLLNRDKSYWYRHLLNNEPIPLETVLSEIEENNDAMSGLQKAKEALGTDDFYVIFSKW